MLIDHHHTEIYQTYQPAYIQAFQQNGAQNAPAYAQRPDQQAAHENAENIFTADNAAAISLEKFTEKLDSIKSHVSSRRCARSIRLALESAGAVIGSHPVAAADWGGTLTKIGYKQIEPEFDHPQEGDIYIIHRTHKHAYGHIAGFSGSEWVSDFKQKSYDVYKGDDVEYEYYRLGL